MFKKTRTPAQPTKALAAPNDPITALEAAIIAGSEESWEWNGVSHEERRRLRPAVAALAQNVTDQLRAEHRSRQGEKP